MERKLVEVERGNVVLEVPEDVVQRYIDRGFNLIDKHGNVVKASIPNDVGSLQLAFVQHTKEIEQLKNEIAQLKERKAPTRKKKSE